MELEVGIEFAIKAGATAAADCVGTNVPRVRRDAILVDCVRIALVTESRVAIEVEMAVVDGIGAEAPLVSGSGTSVTVVRTPSPLIIAVAIGCCCCG